MTKTTLMGGPLDGYPIDDPKIDLLGIPLSESELLHLNRALSQTPNQLDSLVAWLNRPPTPLEHAKTVALYRRSKNAYSFVRTTTPDEFREISQVCGLARPRITKDKYSEAKMAIGAAHETGDVSDQVKQAVFTRWCWLAGVGIARDRGKALLCVIPKDGNEYCIQFEDYGVVTASFDECQDAMLRVAKSDTE